MTAVLLRYMSKETFQQKYPILHYGNMREWFVVMTPDQHICSLGLQSFPDVQRLLKKYKAHQLIQKFLSLESSLPCLLVGTPFQHKVWKALTEIPQGSTWSYQDLAIHLGHPKAVRAVANAVGANPISPLIPCHRVIRNNGHLGGYYWGVDEKIKLLKAEGASSHIFFLYNRDKYK